MRQSLRLRRYLRHQTEVGRSRERQGIFLNSPTSKGREREQSLPLVNGSEGRTVMTFASAELSESYLSPVDKCRSRHEQRETLSASHFSLLSMCWQLVCFEPHPSQAHLACTRRSLWRTEVDYHELHRSWPRESFHRREGGHHRSPLGSHTCKFLHFVERRS